jgi:hypothetical protein
LTVWFVYARLGIKARAGLILNVGVNVTDLRP